MKQENYNVIGVMSGTSLDGIDLAHIQFEILNGKWQFEILETQTVPYTTEWLDILKTAINYDDKALLKLNEDYTELLANIITLFIKKNNINDLDAVCSHGHTILHQPDKGLTLQIGNLPIIAKWINQKVVCDFRSQDVALGGQGAPLVPIGDQILFSEYDYCMNLGGFSNISFLKNNEQIAFDISAVNTVLNHYANVLGFEYDDKGKIAETGNINNLLLKELNNLDFYTKKHPKSLGFEYVKDVIIPLIEKYKISIEDKLKTYVEHVAIQISIALPVKKGSLFITGGGAYNNYLIYRIQDHLPKIEIIIPESKILEFKEALIFGLLGVLKLKNKINVLKSVTGASKNHTSGMIY